MQITNCGSTHSYVYIHRYRNFISSNISNKGIAACCIETENFIKRVRVEINSMLKLRLVFRKVQNSHRVNSLRCVKARRVSAQVWLQSAVVWLLKSLKTMRKNINLLTRDAEYFVGCAPITVENGRRGRVSVSSETSVHTSASDYKMSHPTTQ